MEGIGRWRFGSEHFFKLIVVGGRKGRMLEKRWGGTKPDVRDREREREGQREANGWCKQQRLEMQRRQGCQERAQRE